MKITLNIEPRGHKEKPAGAAAGGVSNATRTKEAIKTIEAEALARYIEKGHTFTPAVITREFLTNPDGTPEIDKRTGQQKSVLKWHSQQVLCIDIDNEEFLKDDNGQPIPGPDGKQLKKCVDNPTLPRDALTILKEHDIKAAIVYLSFSCTETWPRFRIVLFLPEPMSNMEKAMEYTKRLCLIIPHSDPAIATPERLIFGGNENCILLDKPGNIATFAALDALPELPPAPPAKRGEAAAAGLVKPLEELKRQRVENSGAGTVAEWSERLTRDIDAFDMAEFIETTAGARRIMRGRIQYMSPCPICGRDTNNLEVTGNVWHCYDVANNTGIAGGTIIDYLMAVYGLDKAGAMEKFEFDIMGYDRNEKRKLLAREYAKQKGDAEAAERARQWEENHAAELAEWLTGANKKAEPAALPTPAEKAQEGHTSGEKPETLAEYKAKKKAEAAAAQEASEPGTMAGYIADTLEYYSFEIEIDEFPEMEADRRAEIAAAEFGFLKWQNGTLSAADIATMQKYTFNNLSDPEALQAFFISDHGEIIKRLENGHGRVFDYMNKYPEALGSVPQEATEADDNIIYNWDSTIERDEKPETESEALRQAKIYIESFVKETEKKDGPRDRWESYELEDVIYSGALQYFKGLYIKNGTLTPEEIDALAEYDGTIYDADELAELFNVTFANVEPAEKLAPPAEHVENSEAEKEAAEAPGEPEAAPDPTPQEPQKDRLTSFFERIQTRIFEPYKTGLEFFDNDLLGGGVVRQSVMLLLAAPSAGKTALCQQIGESIAKNGHEVIYLNLEMSYEQMLARSLSGRTTRAGVPMAALDILQGYKWTEAEREAVEHSLAEYREQIGGRMFYNPEGVGADFDRIKEALGKTGEAYKAAGKPGPVVIVDYLHLITSSARIDTHELIKNTMQMLKEYALKFDSFVIAIGATNRDTNKNGPVTMASGRDSSNLEYGADYIITLNYQAVDEADETLTADEMAAERLKTPRDMILRCEKVRLGIAGRKVYVKFDAACSTFYGTEFMPGVGEARENVFNTRKGRAYTFDGTIKKDEPPKASNRRKSNRK